MKELLDKLSTYNIFNYLFPGCIFVAMSSKCDISIKQGDLLLAPFVYYFIGLIISRLGSIVIEPVYKYFKIVTFVDYGAFLSAKKLDAQIEMLSEQNNMYRTLVALQAIMIIVMLGCWKFRGNDIWASPYVYIIIGLFFLFSLAYRKQTSYIRKRTTPN